MSALGKLKFVCLMLLLVTASARAQPALYFVYTDHLNTPRLVENQSGQTVWRWDQQEPFGDNAADENPGGLGTFELPLRLPGQYSDKETNTHYNYFRDYDPASGRYVASDPMGLSAGLNTYAYVSGNPTGFADRMGLFISSVDAYCAQRPQECAEILGDMIKNNSQIVEGCVTDEAQQAADALRGLGDLTTVLAVTSVVKGLGGAITKGKGVGSLDDLSKAAGEPDRNGLTKAGRSLQKHGGRPGSAFPSVSGHTNLNKTAQDVVDDILTTPGAIHEPNRFGGVDIRVPGGRQVRYDGSGKFMGFLEPKR